MNRKSVNFVLAEAAARLSVAEVHSPRLDARVLLAHALGVRSDSLLTIDQVDEARLRKFEELVGRRAAREPVAYITGMKEFFSLEFEVGPGVLIPRPETETLVEEAFREFPDPDAGLDVLDLGTGSGCLIVSFLERYGRAKGIGIDASAESLVWASRNSSRHGVSNRCEFARGGWNVTGTFDVVFANPPYLSEQELAEAAPEIRVYEPKAAFIAGCDGLASYRALAPELAGTLRPQGLAFVEIGAGQAPNVVSILENSGLELRRIAPDLTGTPRCIIVGRRH
jgi:release factor glutamine methyltransferase